MASTYSLQYKRRERQMIQAAQTQALARRIGRYLLQISVVFVSYLVAGKLGQATTNIRSSNLGPVWPAYGVALAAILICGYVLARGGGWGISGGILQPRCSRGCIRASGWSDNSSGNGCFPAPPLYQF